MWLALALDRQEVFVGLAVLATLATIALLVATVRAEVRERRGRAEQEGIDRAVRDPREALALVGDALAATHDPNALLPVILRATVEATGAAGGVVLAGETTVASIGERGARAEAMELDLGPGVADGAASVRLYARPGGFDAEARRLAAWLVSQAGIALENAYLHDAVQRQAVTDELTGLVNRRRFMSALDGEVARVARHGGSLSVVLADLDDFKLVNDQHGHAVGDEFLAAFASALRAAVRDIDVAARLGGEEFGILLTETEVPGAIAVAERLRAAVNAAPLELSEGLRLPVSASFGVAQHRAGEQPSELLRRADAALYRAKAAGKNRVDAAAA
jgi:diguanylate cyclase (GGDEF)-like protein